MTTWVLIVYLANSQVHLPLASYPTEAACLKALVEWEFEPGYGGTCLPGVIEPERRRRPRR